MIILTGFGPYNNYRDNVSNKVVQALDITDFNIQIRKLILPVSWNSSVRHYKEILNKLSSTPNIVILLGIHSSKHYCLENLAWNFAFGKDIDNRIKFGIIRNKFNLWLRTNLDVKRIYSMLKKQIDIKLSNFPGFYLCNYIYYWALSLSNDHYPVLFIHIPHRETISKGVENISKIIKNITLFYDQLV